MSTSNATPARRERVERNIFRRTGADGKDRFELSFRDSSGRQRFRTLPPGTTKTQARAERDAILGAKGKGEHVQPNPNLRFGEAAARWLAEQVTQLRGTTQTSYETAVRLHLNPRWARRRLDSITVDDAAHLVGELPYQGLAERSIGGITQVASRVFQFARRRMNWHGQNPIPLLERGERPRATTSRRRIYEGDELAQTLDGASEPWKTLFALAAVTGARLSELLGITWDDLDLRNPEAACVHFHRQVDRKGRPQPLKTDNAEWTVELPRSLVALLTPAQSPLPSKYRSRLRVCHQDGEAPRSAQRHAGT
jgi:integrase